MEIHEHIPLAPLTTFKIGGPARYFVRVHSIDELKEAFNFARDENQKILILGGGSNVLIDDAGVDGLVIKIEFSGIDPVKSSDDHGAGKVLLIAGAGESWDALVERAIHENLWGIENLSGIPGSVGGAVAGNIGAYGQALSQTCAWVEVYDTETGEIKKINNTECEFGYRESVFSNSFTENLRSGEIYLTPARRFSAPLVMLRAAFTLSSTPKPDLSYKDLKERFADSSLRLEDIREAVLTIRRAKFPDLEEEGTAGSFFKNPILSGDDAAALHAQYPQMPVFAMPETTGVKIPLAWILDKILNLRGMRVGAARLYEKQPLVIVAEKNCTAHDVRELARQVKEKVKINFNLEIEEEVRIL